MDGWTGLVAGWGSDAGWDRDVDQHDRRSKPASGNEGQGGEAKRPGASPGCDDQEAEGEERSDDEGDRNRESGLRRGDVELAGEDASFQVVHPVQLGVVGGEEGGHRASLVGC